MATLFNQFVFDVMFIDVSILCQISKKLNIFLMFTYNPIFILQMYLLSLTNYYFLSNLKMICFHLLLEVKIIPVYIFADFYHLFHIFPLHFFHYIFIWNFLSVLSQISVIINENVTIYKYTNQNLISHLFYWNIPKFLTSRFKNSLSLISILNKHFVSHLNLSCSSKSLKIKVRVFKLLLYAYCKI